MSKTKSKSKKHPLIKEIQLGKTVDEVVKEHFSDCGFQDDTSNIEERLPDVIREIVKAKNENLRFVVKVEADCCSIFMLNADSDLRIEGYMSDANYGEGFYPLIDNAHADCEILNNITQKIYGVKRKKAKPKLTNEQFLEKGGKVCPFCGGRAVMVLDDSTYKDRDSVGCEKCGEIWDCLYERVAVEFQA